MPTLSSETDLTVSRFIHDIGWDVLSADVRERALICLMDNLGAALIGTQVKSTRVAAESALEIFPGDQATLFFMGRKASVLGAAFANGVAANAIDIDDSGAFTWGHPGAQVLPAALAVCEHTRASGVEMLAATVVGYEIMFRAGRCWYDRDPLLRGCGSWGSIGCAAMAAKVLRLSPDQTMNALGIAEYHSPSLPLIRSVEEPKMVKHGMGLGPLTGIMAAHLAAKGFTGITNIFNEEKYQEWVSDLGSHYFLPEGISWKEFACCAWSHPALLGMQRLLAEHEFSTDQISKIRVEVYEAASHLGTVLPETTEQAQFSLTWPIAAMVADGEVGPKQVLEPRLGDEHIRTMAGKVEIIVSPELTHLYELCERLDPEGLDGSRVTIELDDGRTLESGLVSIPPYAKQVWDRKRMERKFRWLLADLIPIEKIDRLTEMIWDFERLRDVMEFTEFISELRLKPSSL